MFQEWLRGRDDLYGHLTEDDLQKAFAPFFSVVDRNELGNGRVLFLLAKGPRSEEGQEQVRPKGQHALRSGTVMIKRIAQACGFAAILLLPNYIDITSSASDSRMRFAFPLTTIALAHLLDLAIVAIVFGSAMWALRRLKAWPNIRWVLFILLPPFLFVSNLSVFPFEVPIRRGSWRHRPLDRRRGPADSASAGIRN